MAENLDHTPGSMTADAATGTTAPRRGFVPTLEGMRAIAAFAVLFLHVGVYTGLVGSFVFEAPGAGLIGAIVSHGDIGVPIFFVLSGLLLYGPFAGATVTGRRLPDARGYLWRRALRILPAYWVMTVAALLYFNQDSLQSLWDWLRPLLLLHIYEQNALPVGSGQTWSLAAEWVFYLLLPGLALLFRAFARRADDVAARARRVIGCAALLGLLYIPWTVYTHRPEIGIYPKQYLWLPEYIGYFAAGMALAALVAWRREAPHTVPAAVRWLGRRPALYWFGALLVFVVILTPLGGPQDIHYAKPWEAVSRHLLYALCAVLLVAPLALTDVGEPRTRLFEATLANPIMRYCGRISYGIFLWHLFVLDWYYLGRTPGTGSFAVVSAIVLGGTLVLASLSYLLVEVPAQRLRPVVGRVPVSPLIGGNPENPLPGRAPEPPLPSIAPANQPLS